MQTNLNDQEEVCALVRLFIGIQDVAAMVGAYWTEFFYFTNSRVFYVNKITYFRLMALEHGLSIEADIRKSQARLHRLTHHLRCIDVEMSCVAKGEAVKVYSCCGAHLTAYPVSRFTVQQEIKQNTSASTTEPPSHKRRRLLTASGRDEFIEVYVEMVGRGPDDYNVWTWVKDDSDFICHITA
jgi:hypothetical protein